MRISLPRYNEAFAKDGTILYLENCELPPPELVRTLWNLRLAGWFENVSGLVIGRSSGPDAKSSAELSYVEALASVLGDLDKPIVYDADIGHVPPQLNTINGALATIELSAGRGTLTQKLV